MAKCGRLATVETVLKGMTFVSRIQAGSAFYRPDWGASWLERASADDSAFWISEVSSKSLLVFGIVNRETPQSRQTDSFGNNHTPGLSRFSGPDKWTIISAVNSA
jgi:hypothetical protein